MRSRKDWIPRVTFLEMGTFSFAGMEDGKALLHSESGKTYQAELNGIKTLSPVWDAGATDWIRCSDAPTMEE